MYSDPMEADTDGDLISDDYDAEPLVTNYRTYDRAAAVAYALLWGGDDTKNIQLHNEDYYYLGEPDCANFVSQCVSEGGYIHDTNWFMREYSGNLLSALFQQILEASHYDSGWMWSDSWVIAEEQYYYMSANHSSYTSVIHSSDELIEMIENNYIQPGVLLYFGSSNGVCHATIITKVSDNDICYAAHTSYCTSKSFMENYKHFSSTYAFFAIVCLQDYEGEIQ